MKIRFSADPVVAHETNGLAIRYASSKRQIANWRWRILVLFVLAPLLVFGARLLYGAVWADMPGFVAIDETVLKAPVAGRIVNTLPVGTPVKAGDIIAELRNDVIEHEYKYLVDTHRAKVERITANQDNAGKTGVDSSAVRSYSTAKNAVNDAQELFELRRQQYAKLTELADQGAATQAEVAASYAPLSAAQRDLRTAQRELIDAQAMMTPSPVRKINAATSNELAEDPRIGEKAAMLDAMKVRATEDGIVAQVFGKQGEWIISGAEVASLRVKRPAKIEVFVEPSWAKYATVNSMATVNFLDGYSHRARVQEVKMQAQRLPPDRANPLTVRHHSVVVLLNPVEGLPEQYRVNVLPVNVQFDRDFQIERLAFWRHFGQQKERLASADQIKP